MIRHLLASALRVVADWLEPETPLDMGWAVAPDREPSCRWCRVAAKCDEHVDSPEVAEARERLARVVMPVRAPSCKTVRR